MGAVHWLYDGGNGLTAKTSAFVTDYRNRFSLDMPDASFQLPSGITDLGLKSDIAWKGWTAGVMTS
ncbi:MAG: hypothetical protein J6X34_06500, partial [Clostridia bacterium]|nr:hypothetical protein [Clostridia bacterium]